MGENDAVVQNDAANEFEDDELDLVIAELTGDDNIERQPKLKNDESFAKIFGGETETNKNLNPETEVTNLEKEFDSSDDEDVQNFLEQKYNQYGRDINKKIKLKKAENKEREIGREVDNYLKETQNELFSKNKKRISKASGPKEIKKNPTGVYKELQINSNNNSNKKIVSQENAQNPISNWLKKEDVYRDPIFGMRIINPLMASNVLVARMERKKAVSLAGLQYHIDHGDVSEDWVVAGVIVNKSSVKETQKGASYCIWKISDLKGDIKCASLFLFSSAYSALWKTPLGTVIAILNPGNFDKSTDRNDVATLKIDKENHVMILGQSKDFGTCKAKKKNGENCTAIINLGECDFCVYHVKQEFGKMSRRSELQSSTAGRGLQELRNKILGKSEVFYGGQSFVAVPAKKSAKLIQKDQKRIMSLSEYYHNPNAGSVNHLSVKTKDKKEIPYSARDGLKSRMPGHLEFNTKQRLQDLERLKLLKEEEEKFNNSSNVQENISKSLPSNLVSQSLNVTSSSLLNKSTSLSPSTLKKIPSLTKSNFSLEINMPSSADKAKQKALQILKNKPIEKSNPNFIKYRGTSHGKKRLIDEINEVHNNPEAKRKKVEEEKKAAELNTRIKKIMAATSSHTNLIDLRQLEEQEKYFDKLEKKEQMEEKMLNTFKISCKAVVCLKCKYTAFSAADRCKEERHPLKVIDSEKRFFECKDCSNRTVSLDKIPKQTCSNCKSSRWKKAAMIKERKLIEPGASLSIRGDEEQFLGTLTSKVNIDLLIPGED